MNIVNTISECYYTLWYLHIYIYIYIYIGIGFKLELSKLCKFLLNDVTVASITVLIKLFRPTPPPILCC